ncbi:hypothetical protein LTS10_002078 [Elasticomyces elasticus]|nr:hypothetical protein LTS10_002078 [Elasticomyces elasticus]
MPDMDNFNGGNASLERSNLTNTVESRAETHDHLATFKSHVSTLLTQARKLTDRSQIILDFLNAPYEVRRFTVAEFSSPMEFEDLAQNFVYVVPAMTEAQKSANLVKFSETLVLESGAQLLDTLRAGVATACVKGTQMVREADEASRLTGIGGQAKVIGAYRSTLGACVEVMAETAQSFKDLDERYAFRLTKGSGRRFGDSDVEWKAGLEAIRSKVAEAPGKMGPAAADTGSEDAGEAWEAVRMKVGVPLLRSVAAEYREVKAAYEAAFASALKLAPEVFAYPSWCEPEDDM